MAVSRRPPSRRDARRPRQALRRSDHVPHAAGGGRRSLQLTLLLATALFPTLAAWLYFVVWAHTPWMRALYAGCKLVQLALPLLGWWALGMERRPAWSADPAAILGGVASGAAMAGLALAALAGALGSWLPMAGLAGRIHQRLLDLHAATPPRYLLLALALSVGHSLFEEVYWRWFLLGQLERRLPFAVALPLASLAFASHHWIVVDSFLGGTHRLTATLPLTLLIAAGGGLWGWLLHRHRSLLAPWLSHLMVDGALMAIGWRLVFGR